MDDYSFAPIAPTLERSEIEEQDLVIDEFDKRLAEVYYDGKWGVVEQMLVEAINEYSDVGLISPELSAQEYKVEALSNLKTKANLVALLERIKNAVRASESRRKSGGK